MQTLKELIFHKAAEHLLTQGKQSRRTTGCAYRGDGGTMCAIGALISDEHYDSVLEGKTASEPCVVQAVEASLGVSIVDTDTLRLMFHLQQVHDATTPDWWAAELQSVAHEYNIEWKRPCKHLRN